jgi:hypothetical protein
MWLQRNSSLGHTGELLIVFGCQKTTVRDYSRCRSDTLLGRRQQLFVVQEMAIRVSLRIKNKSNVVI